MKYVLLFVAAILLMKIDAVIELGEKAWMTVKSEEEPKDRPEDLGDAKEIVPPEDKVKLLTPRQQYLNFLDSFRASPDLVYREKAMALFKEHPMMFTDKLDKDLEARIYSWRDLAVQNTPELPLFLLDLANILKGHERKNRNETDDENRFIADLIDDVPECSRGKIPDVFDGPDQPFTHDLICCT
jgi:hypothetical protein